MNARAIAWLVITALVLVWLFVQLQSGCTCIVNEVTPTANAADSGLVELDDSGAESL